MRTSLGLPSKILALMRLTRLSLCILLGAAVVVGIHQLPTSLALWKTFISSLVIMFMAGGGLALNDYRDIKRDELNAPHRPLVKGALEHRTGLRAGVILICLAVGLSTLLGTWALAYTCGLGVLVVFYSYAPYRFLRWSKNLLTAVLGVSPFGMASVVSGTFGELGNVMVIAGLFILGREMLMDIKDKRGDGKARLKTPVQYMKNWQALAVSFGVMALSLVLAMVFGYTRQYGLGFHLAIIVCLMLTPIMLLMFIAAKTQWQKAFVTEATKVQLLLGLAAFLVR